MAVKYYVVPEKRMVVAALNNCQYDACNKLAKLTDELECIVYQDKYKMPNNLRATAVCHSDDVFDAEVGMRIAKEKLMKRYYKHFDQKIALFNEYLERVNSRMTEHINKKVKATENS